MLGSARNQIQKLRQYKEERCLDFLLYPGLLVLRALCFPSSALLELFQGVPYFLMEENDTFSSMPHCALSAGQPGVKAR